MRRFHPFRLLCLFWAHIKCEAYLFFFSFRGESKFCWLSEDNRTIQIAVVRGTVMSVNNPLEVVRVFWRED